MWLQILKKSLCRACVAYTVLSMIYLVIMLDLYKTSVNPYPLTILRMFPLCFFVAFASTLTLEIKKKGAWKLPAHFLIVTAAILLFVWFPAKDTLSPSAALILFVIYLVIYAIGALIVKFLSQKKEDPDEYQSVYKQNKRK